ncbi:MAG TPA: hypothetical protein VFD06_12475 [Candidatus Polarisedimenticolia bacterium]|nr:hypothetical protein [Candidatus Polarisedimenticolia bacterium]
MGRREWVAVVACVLLLAVFATLSWSAAATKSPVYDEPLHTVGGYLIRNEGDFRVDPDHPSLWLRWASVLNGPGSLRPDHASPEWDRMFTNYWSCYLFSADTLYRSPGVDPDRVVARARVMMLVAAVALGALLAFWAWHLAGPIAAVAALALFALDPALIGHASLVKNDVAVAFVTLLLAFSVWRLGERLTVPRAVLTAAAFAAGFGVKYSALLFLPLLVLLLIVRAVLSSDWPSVRGPLARRGHRLIAAGAVLVLCCTAAWGSIWATGGFRFAPTPESDRSLDIDALFRRMEKNHQEVARFVAADRGATAIAAAAPPWKPGPLLRAVRAAEEHRLLPQAWLYGIVYTAEGMQRREGFLLGERRLTGWWYYLPVAFLFKAPIATLTSLALAAAAFFPVLGRTHRPTSARRLWTAAGLVLPPLVFGLAALASKVSLGLRHAFVLYPFLFLGAGVVAAECHRRWRRPVAALLLLLLAGLAVETLPAWPDEIAFFNLPSRPSRLALLGDSNFDWGQDLPRLAAWRRAHPEEPLYLAYFGQADPAHYGIDARSLPTSRRDEPGTTLPSPGERATLAISATHLQGIYVKDPWLQGFYAAARWQRPKGILGTIYLYDVGLSADGSPRAASENLTPNPSEE